MNTTDLHALYASRAIGKARAFLNRGGAGSSSSGVGSSSAGGGVGGGGGLSKSPSLGGFAGGGSLERQIVSAEVNRRDHWGRTVLHLAVSELEAWALDWVELLLNVPGLAVNLGDAESGWSALHRALYAGNIAAARMLLARDDIDTRLKDSEGLSPFDVYNSTVDGTNPSDHFSLISHPNPGRVELFSWGSNRNFVLGFASDSERLYPERVQLKREGVKAAEGGLAKFEPCRVRDVSMARLHTGIVTDEQRGNVRLCGYGTGGRLGPTTQTQFTFAPLRDFPHQVSSVVLSPDHTVVIATAGDVYTFGLNRFSQLGYALDSPTPSQPRPSSSSDEPIQSTPRRVVGALKKEVVLGAAASRTHTAVFTADSLYTWGTNRGQLGYPAAGTPIQVLPRKVTLIQQPVIQLTATENATACLLESRDVVVLYHEAYLKIAFPLNPFPSRMAPYRPPQVSAKPSIRKIASCGNTFAALSSLGDVFTFSLDSGSSTSAAAAMVNSGSASSFDGTSSPGHALSRLTPKPQRIWNLRRKFTAVTDVGVGLDGSIIICTVSGHVFLRSKKYESSLSKSSGGLPSTPSSTSSAGGGWKFSRVPYLQRVIKVAANSTGGFAALRADVPLRFIEIEDATLARDLLDILPHWRRIGPLVPSRSAQQQGRKKKDAGGGADSDEEDDVDAAIERDVEVAIKLMGVLKRWDLTWEVPLAGTDAIVNVGAKSLPVHKTILAARSPVLAKHFSTPTARAIDLDCSDVAALLLVHYLYSDDLPAVWDSRIGMPLQAALPAGTKLEVGVVKTELRQLAQSLELHALSQALERQVKTTPAPTLAANLSDLLHRSFSQKDLAAPLQPDVVLDLADRSVPCHAAILRARCPFFATFFDDHEWTSTRREGGTVRIDLRHVGWDVMRLVLEHVYRDAGMSLFQGVDRPTPEEYIDFTVQVLAVANELLLDKLKQVCSAVLRSFVTLQNVCSILCDAAFYEAHDLARACMYFLTTSMETVLESYLLDDLPPDLLTALTTFVQERQGAKMPVSRSGLLLQEALSKHADYIAELDVGRPTGGAKRFRPNIGTNMPRPSPSLLSPGPSPQLAPTPSKSPRMRASASPNASPSLSAVREVDEPFTLDEDFLLDQSSVGPSASVPSMARRRSSVAPVVVGSPSQSSFMPLGSPPPPRLQPWSSQPDANKAPLDLRSIMATESAAAGRRASTSKGFVSPPSGSASPGSTSLSASAASWRPVPAARPSSLASIQSEQATSMPVRRPSVPGLSSTPPSRSSGTFPSLSARPAPSPSPSSPAVRPSDPAAATGPVYTPSRLAPAASRTSSSSSSNPRVPKPSFGGSDTPWQNFERIAAPAPPPLVAATTVPAFDPFARAPGPATSFAAIQSEQKAQLAAVKSHQAPRSFAEVMAQEQQAARRREEEERDAREFARWFEEESRRVQEEERALRGAAAGGGRAGGAGKGKKGAGGGGGGGRGGAGAGAGAGRGKGGGKKSGGGGAQQQQPGTSEGEAPPAAAGSSTPKKGGRGGAQGRGKGRGSAGPQAAVPPAAAQNGVKV
ncbi:hypothetical protein JCM5296_005430 [Sporobolomyces johnsonii]